MPFSSLFACRSFTSRPPASLALLILASCGRSPSPAEPIADASTTATTPAATPPLPTPAASRTTGETWNAAAIDWQPYAAGLQTAKTSHKPVCLVFYTTWCPHCRNFSHVFDDPRVVEQARNFVMVRLDADAEPAIASNYQLDGGYIPRTYFLAPDGTIERDIHPARARSLYFYDERDPGSLLAGMSASLGKLTK